MRLSWKSLFQTGVFLNVTTSLLVHSERSEDEIFNLVTEDKAGRNAEELNRLAGRFNMDRKKSLPKGDLFAPDHNYFDELECDETYDIDKEGHLYFKLQPQPSSKPCQYNFLGSRKRGCTVAMLCKGKITLAPPSAKGCDREFLRISDGTEGMMSGCGNFTFGEKPRIARNGGKDLYVSIKGSSPKRCIVFCIEELGSGRPGIKETRPISPNKKYTGLDLEKGCTCGKRHDVGRIVGGQTAFKHEFPWIGSVVFTSEKFKRRPFCGGSLINDRYLISAAHCFAIEDIEPDEINVLLHHHVMDKIVPGGMNPDDPEFKDIPGWDLKSETDESENSVRVEVEEIINHPLFSSLTFDYDVALLKLKTPVSLLSSNKISPICLPEIKEKFDFEDETIMVVAGWGKPFEGAKVPARILQKLEVPFIHNEICEEYTVPRPRHLCAGYTEGGKDACAGDSGGPLIYKFDGDENRYLLSGIVSAGEGCAREMKLGLYTDVQEVIQWIYQQINKNAKWCGRA